MAAEVRAGAATGQGASLVEALIAVLGIYELVRGAYALASVASILLAGELELWLIFQLLPFLVGGALLALRRPLARALAPRGEIEGAPASELAAALLAVAGVVIALYALSAVVSDVAGHLASRAFLASYGDTPEPLWRAWPRWSARALELTCGVWLALGARGVASFVLRLRTAGAGSRAHGPPPGD